MTLQKGPAGCWHWRWQWRGWQRRWHGRRWWGPGWRRQRQRWQRQRWQGQAVSGRSRRAPRPMARFRVEHARVVPNIYGNSILERQGGISWRVRLVNARHISKLVAIYKHTSNNNHAANAAGSSTSTTHRCTHPAPNLCWAHPPIKDCTKGGARPKAARGGGRRPPPLWVGVRGLGRQQAQQNIEPSKGKVWGWMGCIGSWCWCWIQRRWCQDSCCITGAVPITNPVLIGYE
jgi:hypothetical protein